MIYIQHFRVHVSGTFSFVFFSDQGDYEVYLAFIASYIYPSFEDIQQIFIGNKRENTSVHSISIVVSMQDKHSF